MVNKKWVASTLAYETRTALRRRSAAKEKKERLKQEALGAQVKILKSTPDGDYGDQYNRLVCQRLDQFKTEGKPLPKDQPELAYAEEVIKKEIYETIDDESLIEFLSQKAIVQKKRGLQKTLNSGLKKFRDPEKVIAFAAFMFEVNERKTDVIWQPRKFNEIIIQGLNGETINLISMLCCINQFDLSGSYTLIPNLDAYLENPKLEPVPLIVDELILIKRFFEFYGIKTTLTIYISDTDYTEIGQFGLVTPENLENLRIYLLNLETYLTDKNPDVQIIPISGLTDDNLLYAQVKARVLKNVSKFNDPDFTREWSRKFDDAVERVSESQAKRKLFPSQEIRRKAKEIMRKIWAVNAAQGAVFGTLSPNTIFISTERRERDQNYIVDKETRGNFPPVIYVLRAAEGWNRKLLGVVDY